LYEDVLKAESLTLKATLPAKSTTVSFVFDDKPCICKLFVAGFGEIFISLFETAITFE
jgi:hypothetical protein